MSDVPVQVIVAAFRDEDAAHAALEKLKEAKREGLIRIDNAAVLRKDADGKLHVKETADMGGGKGAAIGGTLGAVVGLVTGPVGWLALGGALVGGAIAKHADGGFSDERLKKLGEGMTPGSSAIVAVIEHTWVKQMEDLMAEQGADVMTAEISADIATQLAAGRDVSYTAVSAGDSVSTSRVAMGDNDAQISGMTATPEGVTGFAVEGTLEDAPEGSEDA
jgi:uncharacterized membrane protein